MPFYHSIFCAETKGKTIRFVSTGVHSCSAAPFFFVSRAPWCLASRGGGEFREGTRVTVRGEQEENKRTKSATTVVSLTSPFFSDKPLSPSCWSVIGKEKKQRYADQHQMSCTQRGLCGIATERTRASAIEKKYRERNKKKKKGLELPHWANNRQLGEPQVHRGQQIFNILEARLRKAVTITLQWSGPDCRCLWLLALFPVHSGSRTPSPSWDSTRISALGKPQDHCKTNTLN